VTDQGAARDLADRDVDLVDLDSDQVVPDRAPAAHHRIAPKVNR